MILVDKETGYGQELQGELYRLMVRLGSDAYLNQRGGIFLLSADQMAAEDRVLLETAARASSWTARAARSPSSWASRATEPVHLPAFVPTLSRPEDVEPTPELPAPDRPAARQRAGRLQPGRPRVPDLPRARANARRARGSM